MRKEVASTPNEWRTTYPPHGYPLRILIPGHFG